MGPEDTETCMLTRMQCMVVMDMVVTAMEECTQVMGMVVVDQLVVKWVVVASEAVEEGDAADHTRSRIMGENIYLSFVEFRNDLYTINTFNYEK